MSVLFLGRLSHIHADGPATATDSDSFRAYLARQFPELAAPTVRLAVNGELIHGPVPVSPGDEIAFLPPMSGG